MKQNLRSVISQVLHRGRSEFIAHAIKVRGTYQVKTAISVESDQGAFQAVPHAVRLNRGGEAISGKNSLIENVETPGIESENGSNGFDDLLSEATQRVPKLPHHFVRFRNVV